MKLSKLLSYFNDAEKREIIKAIEQPEISPAEARKEAIKFLNENFKGWVGIKRYIGGFLKKIIVPLASENAICRFKADFRFAITENDFIRLRQLGLTHMKVNEKGFIDIYFKLEKEYYGEHPVILEINK